MKIKNYSKTKAESAFVAASPKKKRQFVKRALLVIRKTLFGTAFNFLLPVLLLLNVACENPSTKTNANAAPTAAAINAQDSAATLETDLQTMQNAKFDYIFVFRRKDGGVFDGEDKKYLKANSPVFTNRFILTDENKAAIAGSSYKFEPQNLENLEKRFVVENFSKPENPEAVQNSNSNK